jgi:poly(3-hydroxybutyrate) depolymerase
VRRARRRLALAWLTLGSLASVSHAAVGSQADALEQTLDVGGMTRTYYLCVPDSLSAAPAPLIVLLHGSYGSGRRIIELWRDLAAAEGFMLVAPNARNDTAWNLRTDGPAFIRAVVNAANARHPIDIERMYLFGHSGGAVYALTLAMLESRYFAATAVHAGAWRERAEFSVIAHARRDIPLAIFVGDRDPFFHVRDVRRTQAQLIAAGHPVSVTIIDRHDHDYGAVAAEVNRSAWEFLSTQRLESEPVFQSYD